MTRSSKVAALAIVTVLALIAAPRGAPVIPSDTAQGSVAGAVETDPALLGAPLPSRATTTSAVVTSSDGASGAPQPTGMIDAGGASYFKPTPRVVVSKGTGGWATWWFSFGHGYYAALRPDLGTKGDLAIVCGGKPYHCLSLPVITTCACLGPGSDRLIDLSRDAFSSFADPSVGTVRIVLQVVKGGAP